ncbi:hypothetical protein RUND412_002123 [Rhizina undulata]
MFKHTANILSLFKTCAPIHLGSSPPPADPSVSRYEQEAPRNSEPHYLPPDLLRANLLRRAERRVVLNFAGKPCRIPWRTFPVYEATLMPSLRLESTKSTGKLLETEKEAQECPSIPISQQKPAVPWKMISPPPRHWQGLATAYQSEAAVEKMRRDMPGTLIRSQLDLALKTGYLQSLRAFWPRQHPVVTWSSFAVPEKPRKKQATGATPHGSESKKKKRFVKALSRSFPSSPLVRPSSKA